MTTYLPVIIVAAVAVGMLAVAWLLVQPRRPPHLPDAPAAAADDDQAAR